MLDVISNTMRLYGGIRDNMDDISVGHQWVLGKSTQGPISYVMHLGSGSKRGWS